MKSISITQETILLICEYMIISPSHQENQPGCQFNIKMLSYQNNNSSYEDKIVLWLSYFYNWNLYTLKHGINIESSPRRTYVFYGDIPQPFLLVAMRAQ